MACGDPYKIRVTKEVYIEAEQGVSVWVQSPSYATLDGFNMIEAVGCSRRGPVKGDPNTKEYYYATLVYRRLSSDNGETWIDQPILFDQRDGFRGTYVRWAPMHFLDPDNGLLLSLTTDAKLDCAGGKEQWYGEKNIRSRTAKMYYEISRDGGQTFEPSRQIIHRDPQYNQTNWMPDVTYGVNSAHYGQQRFARLGDGTILLPVTKYVTEGSGRNFETCDHKTYKHPAFLLGRWNEDLSGVDWDLSDYLDAPQEERPSGISEPDLVALGGKRVFATFRSMGVKDLGIPSLRMAALSEDGGRTWTQPKPLTYEDGSTVWVPACPSDFFISPVTGRFYWVANIQPAPVYRSSPRYPLTIAEFDPDRLCILKRSVKVAYALPEGAPESRRYSNWGSYIDRASGEFVLTMPEEPKVSWQDYTADAVRFRIALTE